MLFVICTFILNLFNNSWFSFRSHLFTVKTIQSLVENIYCSETKLMSSAILLDLRKAFDFISHNTFINKLNYYGVGGKTFGLISATLITGCNWYQ